MSPPSPKTVQVTGISIDLVERLKHSLYIKFRVDGTDTGSMKLERKEKHVGNRTRSFSEPLNLSEGSTLTIHVQHKHRWFRTYKDLASLDLSFAILWSKKDNGNPASHPRSSNLLILDSRKRQIWLNIHIPASTPPVTEEASESPQTAADSCLKILRKLKESLDRLDGIIYTMPVEAFGTTLSELSPISKRLLDSINILYDQFKAQTQGHERILVLVNSVTGAVDHIQPIKDIAELNELIRPLRTFLDLALETMNFFETWVEHSLPDNISTLPSYEHEIDALLDHYTSFKADFDHAIKLDKDHFNTKLNDLKTLDYHLLRGTKLVNPRAVECIPNTRTRILECIATNIDSRGNANIIFIRGGPGSGKSSISLTVKSQLFRQGRLLTYFRFDRNEVTTTTTTFLWRQVAYDLARRFPSVRTRLLQQIRHDRVDLDSPLTVFLTLVEASLLDSTERSPEQPFVIIIDALDECGGFVGRLSPDRQALLDTVRRWPQLPKHFKLLVTSRDEGDITPVLSSISTVIDIPSGLLLTNNPRSQISIDTANDISTYLESRFDQIRKLFPSLLPDWPGKVVIAKMVDRAAGNFMWTTTATNFIRSAHPQKRLDIIMGRAPKSTSMKELYSLYSDILETSLSGFADDSEAELRAVLGTIVFAQRPLNDDDYTILLPDQQVDKTTVELIRDRLYSVLDQGPNLRFVHKSFDDFLLSDECPSKYRIRPDESHYLLARLCLTTMTEGLRFNMCNLETSHLKNVDMPDIGVKITNGIPTLLAYSCCFFADHLSCTPFEDYLMGETKAMIMDKLLYWFEAMSLLGEINRISHSLLLLSKWAHPSPDVTFENFIDDARRFIGAFGHPIAQSAPHVYISALPLAPQDSPVSEEFLSRFPGTLTLSKGKPTNWPSCVFSSEIHRAEARSVAFSPDEKHFVSGSADKTICICDSETGIRTSGPFNDDSRFFRVCFDPDGKRIWASCGDDRDKVISNIVAWNVESGDKHVRFQAGTEMDYVFCCCCDGGRNVVSASRSQGKVTLWSADGKRMLDLLTDVGAYTTSFSPDGIYMACAGPKDTSVRISNLAEARRGKQSQLRAETRAEHTKPISALAFSAEGHFVVSGSHDGTILVWDATTSSTLGHPLPTDRGRLDAVAYSPREKLLVSASGINGTVMVWNASTHERILGPLNGHTKWVTEIVLSRDGRRALSTSWDRTVRMWDLKIKPGTAPTPDVDNGHITTVCCVTFSPCGEKLASLGQDSSIRVWDGNTGKHVLGPIKCASGYSQITFSPDGSQIVAYGSADGTVQAWDASTGSPGFYPDMSDYNYPCKQIQHLAFQSTNQRLVTCSSNGVVRVGSVKTGAIMENLSESSPQPKGGVKFVALSPDGSTAVVRADNGNPHHYIWSTTDSQSLTIDDHQFLSGHQVVYSPNGKLFAAAHSSGSGGVSALRVWNTRTGKLSKPPSTLNQTIGCLAFSYNGRYIAFSDTHSSTSDATALWIWDVDAGRLVSGPWKGHTSNVTALSFSSNGKKLVSGSSDGQIRIWNTDNLLRASQLPGGLSGAERRMQDGWITDTEGNMLFWVPKDYREKLLWPGNVAVMGRRGITTELDLVRFRCGEHWTECFSAGNC